MGKTVIGLVESVTLRGVSKEKKTLAKIDTGAHRTTVDIELAAEVGLGPVVDTVKTKTVSSNSSEKRAVLKAEIGLTGHIYELDVGIVDRTNMKYPVIVGQDLLEQGDFLIDPKKPVPNEAE